MILDKEGNAYYMDARGAKMLFWQKLQYDLIMHGHGVPAMLKGVCQGTGGILYGPQIALIGDDSMRKEGIIINLEEVETDKTDCYLNRWIDISKKMLK